MLLEEFVERRRRDADVGVRQLEEARERHLPEFVVMPVAFAVGRRYQDAALSLDGGVNHSFLKGVAVVEQAAEGYVARYAGVVEEYRHRASRRKLAAVRARHVEVRAARRLDRAGLRDYRPALRGREYHVFDAARRERLERRRIDGALGQPHALRLAAVAVLEVLDPPHSLRQPVAFRRERHDYVVVGLGHSPFA